MLLLAGEREGSAPCWTEGTVRGRTCGVVRAGREVFPGGAWAWARALNQKKVLGREQRHGLLFSDPHPPAQASRPRVPGLVPTSLPQRSLSRSHSGSGPPSDALRPPFATFFFFFFCSKHVSWCEITGPLVRCQDSCQRQPTAPHRAISFPGAQTLSVFVTGAALASGRGFGTREGLSHSSNQLARSFVHSWSCFPPKSEGKRPRPPCQAPERKCEVCSRLFSCLRRV